MSRNDDEIWEDFFSDKERRDSRFERKRMRAKDRSQYKKTDSAKETHQLPEGGERGRVVEIRADIIRIRTPDKTVEARVRGALKARAKRLKNIIAVGDFVRFEGDLITAIEPRRTVFARSENLDRNKRQLIAANIDQVIITVAAESPKFNPALVERYLIAAENGGLDPLILINKIDLAKESFDGYVETMRELGYRTLVASARTSEGIAALKKAMADKASLFSGPSGAGKSSLINAVTGSELKTSATSHSSGKGRHTTTATRLVPVEGGGFCLDTPGVRSFGIWELSYEDIINHFFEIKAAGLYCRYPSCRHMGEAGCIFEEGRLEEILSEQGASVIKISDHRFRAYRALVSELDETHKRR
jgi:ribosome biogenesis GTPase